MSKIVLQDSRFLAVVLNIFFWISKCWNLPKKCSRISGHQVYAPDTNCCNTIPHHFFHNSTINHYYINRNNKPLQKLIMNITTNYLYSKPSNINQHSWLYPPTVYGFLLFHVKFCLCYDVNIVNTVNYQNSFFHSLNSYCQPLHALFQNTQLSNLFHHRSSYISRL